MSDTTTFLNELTNLLGERGLVREPEAMARYTSDWAGDTLGTPLAVARPANTADVAEVAKRCYEHGIAMTPQGGHSGLVAGALPDANGQ